MGMSIDKSIAELEVLKGNTFSYMPAHQSFITAIETMRKYQKIKEIIADWRNDGGAFEMSESYWLRLISEEVEDGKFN